MPRRDRVATGDVLLVDGHVHFHRCFDARCFLEAAALNVTVEASARGAGNFCGMLMLTEAHGEHAFARLRDALDAGGVWGWTARPTAEATSIMAVRQGSDALVLVAGRQVSTREGIEVLAFNTAEALDDAASLEDTLEAVWAAGSLAVIPWGFGKWWGRRGKTVRRTLTRARGRRPMLGDNAGRPEATRDPALFTLARLYGVPVIPGSDPLPVPSESRKAGKYGFVLPGDFDRQRPGEAAVNALVRQGEHIERFGTRERLLRFARLQIAMQWRMRADRGAR